jgi:hypothetical protein
MSCVNLDKSFPHSVPGLPYLYKRFTLSHLPPKIVVNNIETGGRKRKRIRKAKEQLHSL